MFTVPAYAKINLTLEVLGRYDDGYHEIASIMQLIDLHDTLSFELGEDVCLSCDLPQLCTDDNLVIRAARLLQEMTKSEQGALITLQKGIPSGSGLGGGSSDAAATLKALNRLWELNLPTEQLAQLASKVGSDVAFFLNGNTALATGRGEIITPIGSPHEAWVVLLKPPFNVTEKTRRMYARLESRHWTSGVITRRMVEALDRGDQDFDALCFNVFEEVAFSVFAGLDKYRDALRDSGAPSVHLAGAGSALYAIVPSRAEAEAIVSCLEGEVYLAQAF
jgi:4-diphosphocytidyl-2-C-methyl-D-erythritol kinase